MRALLLCLLLALGVAAQPRPTQPNATLWMQRAAEYRALCLQAYSTATRNLDATIALNGGRTTVRDRMMVDGRPQWVERPMAVIMDLDETVIDNSGYQAYLVAAGKSYEPETWAAWLRFQAEEPRAQRSVPGALEFIRHAEGRGVKVVYLSNRPAEAHELTADLLEKMGVGRPDSGRLLLGDKEADARAGALWGEVELLTRAQGAKERRRIEVQLEHHVVSYFGDDLGDFLPYVKRSDVEGDRFAEVESNRARWGTEWYVLPNPTYGSWTEKLDPWPDDFGFSKFLTR